LPHLCSSLAATLQQLCRGFMPGRVSGSCQTRRGEFTLTLMEVSHHQRCPYKVPRCLKPFPEGRAGKLTPQGPLGQHSTDKGANPGKPVPRRARRKADTARPPRAA
jgi:hypothetical protein